MARKVGVVSRAYARLDETNKKILKKRIDAVGEASERDPKTI